MAYRSATRTALIEQTAKPRSARFRAAVLGTTCLIAAAALSDPANAGALPSNGHYVAGKGEIGKAGQSLTVKQSSTTGVIDWKNFSIGEKHAVHFDNGAGATLNRVTGGNLSTIAGTLHATGSLYLMNSQGVIVSGSGRVVTGGSFVATSGTDPDDDLRLHSLNAMVVNRGSIVAGRGVTLAGSVVRDSGSIRASHVDLDARGYLAIDGAIAARKHGAGGTIIVTGKHINVKADAEISANGTRGGTVLIGGDIHGGAIKSDDLVQQTVRTAHKTHVAKGAVISADASRKAGGDIVIWSNGHTTFGGSVVAKGQTAGGFAEVSAHRLLGFTGTANFTSHHGATGTLLLDPENVAITNGSTANGALASGTFTPSGNDSILNAKTLDAALETAAVEITTGSTGAQGGDIAVLAPVTWSSNHTLTLDAFHSVIVEANMSVLGGGALTVVTNDGGSGGSFSLELGAAIDYGATDQGGKLKVNNASYTLLYTMAEVQAVNSHLTKDYALATSLNAASTSSWTPLGTNSSGTVQNATHGFSGVFDGLGNTISGLKISSSNSDVGLFGYSSGTIKDLGLLGGSASGASDVGSLVGDNEGVLANVFSTASVKGTGSFIGGLIGFSSETSSVSQAFSTGAVSAPLAEFVGGLVGDSHGVITESFSTGAVTGGSDVGGFIGYNGGAITNSYSTGAVHGGDSVGGFLGFNETDGTVNEAYATGAATGTSDVGGFVGENAGALGGSVVVVYDTTSNPEGVGSNVGGGASMTYTPASASVMTSSAEFGGWTFGTTPGATGWVVVDSNGSLNNAGSTGGGTTPMLLSEYSLNIVNAHQLQLMELGLSAGYSLRSNIDMSATAGGDVWAAGGFIAIGGNTAAADFTGSLDGGGHSISHLTIDDTTNKFVGLFGELSGNAEDLNLTSVSITATTSTADIGSLAGELVTGNVTGAIASGRISDAAVSGGTGGLVGNSSGEIQSSSSSVKIVDAAGSVGNEGGLVGLSNGTIANSSASGAVSGHGNDNSGGLVGENTGSIISSHATGNVGATSASDVFDGGLVGDDADGLIVSSYATGKVSGDNGSDDGGLIGYSNLTTVQDSYAKGAVSGLDSNVGGLIGQLIDGNISGSHATGSVTVTYSVGASNYAGGLIGFVNSTNQSVITDSYATGTVKDAGPSAAAGGLLGYATKAIITSSYATGSASLNGEGSGSYVGGLIGEANDLVNISDSYGTGKVTGDNLSDAGGLIGFSTANNSVNNAYATGSVTGWNAGGLIGSLALGNVVTNSHATGNVTGILNGSTDDVGGLIGVSTGTTEIASDYATGAVDGGSTTADQTIAGGLIGDASGITVSTSYATGAVKDAYIIGGLVGGFNGTMQNSYATGAVTAVASGETGGLAGEAIGSISESYATGNVSALSLPGAFPYIGGLVGFNFAAIDHSFATGNVYAPGSQAEAGGLVGDNLAAISYSYATGSISGDNTGGVSADFGGFVGANRTNGNLTQVYSIGDVTGYGGGVHGGFVGYNGGATNAAYWDTQTSGQSTSFGGVGLTTAQLEAGLPSGFASNQWAIVAGTSLPYLKWQVPSGTPEVVSGTIGGSSNAGISVGLLVNGSAASALVTTSTGANGFYYKLLAPGTISSAGSDVLVYEASGSNHGNVFIENAKGSLTAINLAADTLQVDGTASSETSLLAALEKALGTHSGSDFLYTKTGTFTSGINLNMDLSASSFNIDHAINIGSGDLDIVASGSIAQGSSDAIKAKKLTGSSGKGASFTSATNEITDLGVFTSGGTFALTDALTLTVDGTVNAGTHNLDLTTVGKAHNLDIDAEIEGSTINLVTTGAANESSAGAIVASLLNVTADTGIDLTSKKNKIKKLGTDKTTKGLNKVTL